MTASNDDNATGAASTAAPTTSSQDATTSKSSSSSTQALHRHPSTTSNNNNNPNPPPPSPALSTTSKASSIYSARSHSNSSSCGNSTSGSSRTNNMSVDDILSNPKLSMKRRRKVRDTATVNSHNNSSSSGNRGGGRGSTAANSALQRQTTTSAATTSSTATKLNPGQGERKKRLERLQREQLVQRRLLGQQQQKQQNSEVGRKLFQQQQGTTKEVQEVAHLTTDHTNQRDLSSVTTTAKRRSPRVSTKTVTTYNVAELSKNGISNEFSTTATTSAGPSDQSCQGETTITEKEDHGDHNDDDALNDTMAQNPATTVESALSSLISNYESCISTTYDDNSPPTANQDETEKNEKNATTASAAVSPWSVIQVLPQLLQFVNLKQPTTSTTATATYPSTKSETEQEKQQVYIQKELSKVVSSVATMKRRVMNRTVGLENGTNDGSNNGDEEAAASQQQQIVAKREASLLQMIQIQVWIRMMIWSLEGEAGWTYLEEVMALTEEEDEKVGYDGMKSGKKKQKKKKKKGKRKQSAKDAAGVSTKQDGQTPRQALVDHLTALFELVPYVLPPSMDFSVCVKDILTFGYRQNVPEYGSEILEHFEIELVEPIALRRSGTDDTSRRSTRSEVSHSPVKSGSANGGAGDATSPSRQIAERRAKRQQAYFASLMEEEKASASTTSINADDESATITGSISTVTSTSRGSKRSRGPDIEKDDTKLLKTSMSLTAAVKPKSKENPFLKGSARGTYVGSHLSSKLSNISTLFREVTVPVKKPKMRRTAATASLLATNKRKAAPKEKKRKGDEEGPKAPFNITAKVTREQLHVSEKTRIRETPTKKPRVGRTSFHSGRADTYPPLSTPRRIIEETPAKSSRRVVISETPQPQPRFRRQQLDYLSDATRHHPQGRARNRQHTNNNTNNDSLSPMIQYGGLSPMPQKKNVVADAAKAAARKRK